MANMTIDTQKLKETASNVSTLKGEILDILAQFHTKVANLADTWDSDASRATVQGINELKPKFNNYSDVVDTYVNYLNTTAESYETTETTNKENAEATAEFI